jgi:hypothetical protein
VVSAHLSHRFGAQLTTSGDFYGLPVSMDLVGIDFTSEKIHELTFYRLVIIASCAIYGFVGRDILQERRALSDLYEEIHDLHSTVDQQRNSSIVTLQVEKSAPGKIPKKGL